MMPITLGGWQFSNFTNNQLIQWGCIDKFGNIQIGGTIYIAAPPSNSDIFAMANQAITEFSTGIHLVIPSGTFNAVTTTLELPVAHFGQGSLQMGSDTVINYTGTSYAIEVLGTGLGQLNININGGQIVGTSAGAGGLHLQAFSGAIVRDLHIRGFTNGDGFFNEGVNTADFYSCDSFGNKNGVHNVGVVVSSTNFAANAIHWFGGHIDNNTNWGWFDDGALAATVGSNENNGTIGAVFETNGTNGSGATGNAFIQNCFGCYIRSSYLEYITGGPTNNIALGDASNTAVSTNIQGNFFANATATSTDINDVKTRHTFIDGNIESSSPTNFLNRSVNSALTWFGVNDAPGATNLVGGTTTGLIVPPITTAFTTTAATSDNVVVDGMKSTGACTLQPTNSSADTLLTGTFVSAKTTDQITVTHAATAGATFDVMCTPYKVR